MSATARPALAIRSAPAARWAPWAIVAADVLAIEIAFLLGLGVRRLVAPWFPNGIGPDQYLGVAAGILLLPIINYQLGLYPGLPAGTGGAFAAPHAGDAGGVRRAGGLGQSGGARRVFARGAAGDAAVRAGAAAAGRDRGARRS